MGDMQVKNGGCGISPAGEWVGLIRNTSLLAGRVMSLRTPRSLPLQALGATHV